MYFRVSRGTEAIGLKLDLFELVYVATTTLSLIDGSCTNWGVQNYVRDVISLFLVVSLMSNLVYVNVLLRISFKIVNSYRW
mmetsp:Transcript_4643/g.5368  ORF Transcript_4643/g.5368 Transcript_4643/m.5368 type:complete len:81 (-) Transcript_4643:788-1030(-)